MLSLHALFFFFFLLIISFTRGEVNSAPWNHEEVGSLGMHSSNIKFTSKKYIPNVDESITLSPSNDHPFFLHHDQTTKFTKKESVSSLLSPQLTEVKGFTKDIYAGAVGNFSIYPFGHNGEVLTSDNLQIVLRHNMSDKHSRFITHCEERFCIVHYLCIEAGNYFINLLSHEVHVGESPYVVRVHPGSVDASKTFAMALNKKGKPIHPIIRKTEDTDRSIWLWNAGEENYFTINPRDNYGNKIYRFDYRSLTFSHNLSLSSPLQMKSEFLTDGRFKVLANTTSTMPFRLDILYKGIPILNSPMEVSVFPGEVCPSCTYLQGTGLIDSYVGKQSEVIVISRDKWKNLAPDGFVSATCHSPNCSLAIENHQDGRFSVLFTPYKRENLLLSIRINGIPLPGSPFEIKVKPKEFPLPPIQWNFLGPFNQAKCAKENTQLASLGLCDYQSFKSKVKLSPNVVYPSSLVTGGQVSWRSTRLNATGYAWVKTMGADFFGWLIGEFHVSASGEYNVFCDGIYEYYINDLTFAGGSWHPIILEEGTHTVTLILTSSHGIGHFYCEFTPILEQDSLWPVETIIDIPGDQSWFALIQLVILFHCLQAILGPMYYNRED